MRSLRFIVLPLAALTSSLLWAACGGDDGAADPAPNGDQDVVAPQTDDDADSVAEQESAPPADPDPEIEPEPAYPRCQTTRDCDAASQCVRPGWCMPATGWVEGRFEARIQETPPAMGSMPGEVDGMYRGDGIVLGYGSSAYPALVSNLGAALTITISELRSTEITDHFELSIAELFITPDADIAVQTNTVAGAYYRLDKTSGEAVRTDIARVTGGRVVIDLANTELKQIVIGRFYLTLGPAATAE